MATILIIDKAANRSEKSFDGMKGITTFSVNDLTQANEVLRKEQFDFVLCEESMAFEKDNFIDNCINQQPDIQFFVILPIGSSPQSLPMKKGVSGELERPLDIEQIPKLSGVELLDQSDVDKLFECI